MAKRTLQLDVAYDFDFELISIVSAERDYRLCWLLNRDFKLDFKRQEEIPIHYAKKKKYAYFNLYYFEDELNWLQYYFINNKSQGESLIPELKQVDYLLLIKGGEADSFKDEIMQGLNRMNQVQAILDTNPEHLSSKYNLIFE